MSNQKLVTETGTGADLVDPVPPLGVRVRFWLRRLRYRLAVRLVAPLDGFVVSKAIYEDAAAQLAALAEYVEKSGHLNNRHRAYDVLRNGIGRTTQTLINAAKIGNPGIQLPELRDRYLQARLRHMSRRQRRQAEYRNALQQLMQRGRLPADLQR